MRSSGAVLFSVFALTAGLLLGQAPLRPAAAQRPTAPLDRKAAPTPTARPPLRVPERTRARLANGAELIVAERHELPLVTFDLAFIGGAKQFEPAGKEGVASLTAAMLSEGTKAHSGDELSDALQLLGTTVSAGVTDESGRITFTTTRRNLEPVLKLMAEMLLQPTFPNEAFERLRARALVGLKQSQDRTAVIAGRVFPKVLYGEAHPYGRQVTEESLGAIDVADVVAFHREYFKPGRAVITVVGDVNPQEARSLIERILAAWEPGGSRPDFAYPPVPSRAGTAIYLVDKPGAEQSTVVLGLPGPPRDTPDYYALQVLNTILGGMFQSRLNANLRERNGYTYGIGSRFAYGRGPGPFRASSDLVTDKTDAALVEIMKELRGIRGEIPITDQELETAKMSLVQSLPSLFESTAGAAGALAALEIQGLPSDYYETFERQINAVTREDLHRVAKRYLDLEHLSIVVVGDRSRIEPGLKGTKIAPVILLGPEGDPTPDQ